MLQLTSHISHLFLQTHFILKQCGRHIACKYDRMLIRHRLSICQNFRYMFFLNIYNFPFWNYFFTSYVCLFLRTFKIIHQQKCQLFSNSRVVDGKIYWMMTQTSPTIWWNRLHSEGKEMKCLRPTSAMTQYSDLLPWSIEKLEKHVCSFM